MNNQGVALTYQPYEIAPYACHVYVNHTVC
ncbi:RsiV family protein [Psychrobacter pasteurii]